LETSVISFWATLGAPACAVYGVAAARRECVAEQDRAIGPKGILVFIVLAALVVASARTLTDALSYLFLVTVLSYLAAFDLRAMAVPVIPLLLAIAAGLGVSITQGTAPEGLAAACAGGGAFILIDLVYRRLRGRAGLGAGDALVAALIGAWLGLETLAWSVAFGGVLGLAWALNQRRTEAPLPFVPALAAGAALTLIWRGLGP
jgi:prepilin signal peptidase PulO-like enzyme (type II secretory pathway)